MVKKETPANSQSHWSTQLQIPLLSAINLYLLLAVVNRLQYNFGRLVGTQTVGTLIMSLVYCLFFTSIFTSFFTLHQSLKPSANQANTMATAYLWFVISVILFLIIEILHSLSLTTKLL